MPEDPMDPFSWPSKEHFRGIDNKGNLYEIDRRKLSPRTFNFAAGETGQSMPDNYEIFTTECRQILEATTNKRIFTIITPGNKGGKVIRVEDSELQAAKLGTKQ